MDKIKLDKKKTITYMKSELEYLKYYCANLRLKKALMNDVQQVQEDVMDYLHYSSSVVSASKHYCSKEEPVLRAMEAMARNKEKIKQRDQRAYIIMKGIEQLVDNEKELLIDVYVKQLQRTMIMAKNDHIVESTYHRRLNNALIHLAKILQVEIFISDKNDTILKNSVK